MATIRIRTERKSACAPSELSVHRFGFPEVNLGAKDRHSFGVFSHPNFARFARWFSPAFRPLSQAGCLCHTG